MVWKRATYTSWASLRSIRWKLNLQFFKLSCGHPLGDLWFWYVSLRVLRVTGTRPTGSSGINILLGSKQFVQSEATMESILTCLGRIYESSPSVHVSYIKGSIVLKHGSVIWPARMQGMVTSPNCCFCANDGKLRVILSINNSFSRTEFVLHKLLFNLDLGLPSGISCLIWKYFL